jgi:hypothetical protein
MIYIFLHLVLNFNGTIRHVNTKFFPVKMLLWLIKCNAPFKTALSGGFITAQCNVLKFYVVIHM